MALWLAAAALAVAAAPARLLLVRLLSPGSGASEARLKTVPKTVAPTTLR